MEQIIGAEKEVGLKKINWRNPSPLSSSQGTRRGREAEPSALKGSLLLWAVSRSCATIFCFSSKHNQHCSRLRTPPSQGMYSPQLSRLWQLCPFSQFQELWPPQNHKALETVALPQSQRSSHSLKHTQSWAQLCPELGTFQTPRPAKHLQVYEQVEGLSCI